jgi:hypothetical protein
MVAKFGIHPRLRQEYQYKNQLKPLAKLNPLETKEPNQLVQLVDVFLDEVVVVEAMAGQELCCTTGLASHFHPVLFL